MDSLEVSLWEHLLTVLQQMLQSQQAQSAGLCLSAVVSIGRLLMHAAELCSDLEQVEQLVAMLVQSYVQPQHSRWGKHLQGQCK